VPRPDVSERLPAAVASCERGVVVVSRPSRRGVTRTTSEVEAITLRKDRRVRTVAYATGNTISACAGAGIQRSGCTVSRGRARMSGSYRWALTPALYAMEQRRINSREATATMDTNFDTNLLTTDEVALMTRAPVSTVRYWRFVGTGPRSFRVGRRVLYRAEEVSRWLLEKEQADPAATG